MTNYKIMFQHFSSLLRLQIMQFRHVRPSQSLTWEFPAGADTEWATGAAGRSTVKPEQAPPGGAVRSRRVTRTSEWSLFNGDLRSGFDCNLLDLDSSVLSESSRASSNKTLQGVQNIFVSLLKETASLTRQSTVNQTFVSFLDKVWFQW